MTKIENIPGEICFNCEYWVSCVNRGSCGYCRNGLSDHHGHVIVHFHSACDVFEPKAKVPEESLV